MKINAYHQVRVRDHNRSKDIVCIKRFSLREWMESRYGALTDAQAKKAAGLNWYELDEKSINVPGGKNMLDVARAAFKDEVLEMSIASPDTNIITKERQRMQKAVRTQNESALSVVMEILEEKFENVRRVQGAAYDDTAAIWCKTKKNVIIVRDYPNAFYRRSIEWIVTNRAGVELNRGAILLCTTPKRRVMLAKLYEECKSFECDILEEERVTYLEWEKAKISGRPVSETNEANEAISATPGLPGGDGMSEQSE